MKKRIFICILVACAVMIPLCFVSCGSGTDEQDGDVYTFVLSPTIHDRAEYTDATIELKSSGTFIMTIVNESVFYLYDTTWGPTPDGPQKPLSYKYIYEGTYEKTGENTFKTLSFTAGTEYMTANNEADKNEILEYVKAYDGANEERYNAAFGANGYAAPEEQLGGAFEIMVSKEKNVALVTKEFRWDGKLHREYEYDAELRCIRERSNYIDYSDYYIYDYHYGPDGILSGETDRFIFDTDERTSERISEWIIHNGSRTRTYYKYTVNGVTIEEHYYDENGNEITDQ